jgi:hypothetical protein
MDSGSFVGTTPCPLQIGVTAGGAVRCQQPCNVYLIDGTSDQYCSICSGSAGMHQQFFGSYYLDLVNTGSSPAW